MGKLTKKDIESGQIVKIIYIDYINFKQYNVTYKIDGVRYPIKINVESFINDNRELFDLIYAELLLQDKRELPDPSTIIRPTFKMLSDLKGTPITKSDRDSKEDTRR